MVVGSFEPEALERPNNHRSRHDQATVREDAQDIMDSA